jgi:release factor glutamine methyltransferase
MAPHVLNHEPSQALFVPDDDPLLFYRAIAHFAQSALKPAGELYFEVNALYAEEVKKLLIAMGYRQVVVRKDAFGKPRFVKAVYG